MRFLTKISALTLFAAGMMFGQAPAVPTTGNIGAGGNFPLINSPAVVFATDADHTAVYPEVSGSSGVIKVTSTPSLTATRNLILPLTKGFQFTLINDTTGGQAIQPKGASGTFPPAIPNCSVSAITCAVTVATDGINYFQIGSGGGTLPSGSANQIVATPNGSSGTAGLRAMVPADEPTTTVHGPGSGATSGHNAVCANAGCTAIADGGAAPANLAGYGAKCNGVSLYDGVISASSTTLQSTSAAFVSGDVGKAIDIVGAAASGGRLITTIASVTDAHHVVLSAAASTAVASGGIVVYGTDDTTAIQNALNAAASGAGGGQINTFPGMCVLAGALNTSQQGNSLLAIPYIAGANPSTMGSISIVGTTLSTSYPEYGISVTPPTAGTVFYGMTPGSGTNPTIIGGPTTYQNFTVMTVSLRNLIFRTPGNPTIGAVGFQNVANTLIYQVTADVNVNGLTPLVPVPTHTNAYAFQLPVSGNFGMVDIQDSYATGYYGCFQVTEHANLFSDFGQQCHFGVEFGSGNHLATIHNLLLQWNAIQVYDTAPLNVVGDIDLEDTGGGGSVTTQYDFYAPDITGTLNIRMVGVLGWTVPGGNSGAYPVLGTALASAMNVNVLNSGWTNGTGNFVGGLASAFFSSGPPNALIVSGSGGPTSPNGVYEYQGTLNSRPYYRMQNGSTVFYVYYGTGNPSGQWCLANSLGPQSGYDSFCSTPMSGGEQWANNSTAPAPPNTSASWYADTNNSGTATGTVNIQGGSNASVNSSGAVSQGFVPTSTVIVTGSGSLSPNGTYTYAGLRSGVPYFTATISSTTWYLFQQTAGGIAWCIGRVLPGAGGCATSSTGDYWAVGVANYPPTTSSWTAEVGFTGAVTTSYATSGYFAHLIDASGNEYANSYNTTGATPGASTWVAGVGSVPALAPYGAGFVAPVTGGTSYLFKLPATITAGILHAAAPATGDGVNESVLTSSLVAIADLSATGSPSSTTFLRGDNTWATPAGGVTGTVNQVARLSATNVGTGSTKMSDDLIGFTYTGASANVPNLQVQTTGPASVPTLTSTVASGGTAYPLSSVTGLPTPTTANPLYALIISGGAQYFVKCTAVASLTLTCTQGVGNTASLVPGTTISGAYFVEISELYSQGDSNYFPQVQYWNGRRVAWPAYIGSTYCESNLANATLVGDFCSDGNISSSFGMNTNGNVNAGGYVTGGGYKTNPECTSSASPAVCGFAAAGAVQIPTGTNPTLVVNTALITANSQVFFEPDESLGTLLGTTCNSTLTAVAIGHAITARTPGTSFTIQLNGVVAANGVCGSFHIIN